MEKLRINSGNAAIGVLILVVVMLFLAVGFMLLEVNRNHPRPENPSPNFSSIVPSSNSSNIPDVVGETTIEKADRLSHKWRELWSYYKAGKIDEDEFDHQANLLEGFLQDVVHIASRDKFDKGKIYDFYYEFPSMIVSPFENPVFLPEDIAIWNTYENDQLGVRFKWPEEVFLENYDVENSGRDAYLKIGLEEKTIPKSEYSDERFVISVFMIRNRPTQDWPSPNYIIEFYNDPAMTIGKILEREKVLTKREVNYNGLKYYKIIAERSDSYYIYRDYFLITEINNRVAKFSIDYENLPFEIMIKTLEIY